MKERLVEIIKATPHGMQTLGDVLDSLYIENVMVEHLLENGVIVPPCKVGQTVYVINSLFVSEYTIKEIAYDDIFFRFYCENEKYAIECRNFMFFDERIGKTVFLTREQAQAKLKEGGKG